MKACFGAGCFWHVQEAFDEVKGVTKTLVGFMGGTIKNVSYKDVCTGRTGHAEVVYLENDDKKVSYEKLLEVFWGIHDSTQLNGQGLDIGSQYRSIIFYFNEKQKNTAMKSRREEEKRLGKKVVTQIVKASEFYRAEDYHQKYYKKNKGGGVCPV